jgi:alginate production protein
VNRTPLFLLLACTACTASRMSGLSQLRTGRFVEAKGSVVDGKPRIDSIVEVPRSTDDKADKVELTGPVESATAERLRMLGSDFAIEATTEFENEQKTAVPPFTPAAGDWVRLKARANQETGFRTRTLRQSTARDKWKITGELRNIDPDLGRLDLGGISLPVSQDVEVSTLGGRDPNDPLSLFMADDQKAVPFSIRLGDSLRIGGQASTKVEWNDEFDLDPNNRGDRTKPEAKAKLDALWLLGDSGSYVMGEVSFGRADTWRDGGTDTHEDILELTRAFASLRLHDSLQLVVGRQDFDEEREWLYDEVVDGIRAVAQFGDLEFELGGAVGREGAAEPNAYEDTGLYVGHLRWQVAQDWMLGAYCLQRTDDTAAHFEPMLFGVRSISRPKYGFGHWLELGAARGKVGNRDVQGHAFDLGVLYAFDCWGRPTLGAGIAFGSGETDSSTTEGYRQTGLQDNNDKLGGVTSVRYYGELFDPELSNLMVTSVVGAVRPFANTSLSLLLHSYRQDTAAQGNPDSGLRTSPTGLSTDLGTEIDLVLGYRASGGISLELVAARFQPGDAFANDAAANLLEFTARFSF